MKEKNIYLLKFMAVGNLIMIVTSTIILSTRPLFSGEWRITTIAGTGAAGYSGDNGSAASAQLYNPMGVAVDSSGNIYMADTKNNRIRKINTSGIITTIAGTGAAGYSGDNGNAALAQLYWPSGVTIDGSGNMYIVDRHNHRIRKLSVSGIITTIAGTGVLGYSGDNGSAVSAQLKYPFSVTVDNSDNIYIADVENCRIRKINTSGIITTIAGTGVGGYSGDNGSATSAQLYNPNGVTVDNSGNIYIADSVNSRIRKINTSGIITTIAGTGTEGYSGDNGNAASAQLYRPTYVTVDSSGNKYISDTMNNRIRKINTSGIITTIAGTGVSGYSGDNGNAALAQLYWMGSITVDSSGNIYIADTSNHCIRKVYYVSSGTSGTLNVTAGPNPFYSSKGHTLINFSNVPESIKLKIFNTAGENIFERVFDNTGGSISWSPQNNSGADISSGVYFFVLSDKNNHTKNGKLFIVK